MVRYRIMFKRVAVGLAAAVVPGLVVAVPPVAYDGWTVNAGGVVDSSSSCTAVGVSCTTLVEDTGFLYEEVNTSEYSFLRLILTEPSASGDPSTLDFTNETFIPFAEIGGGILQGMAAKQVIRDQTTNFVATAEIQRSDLRVNALVAEDAFNIKLGQNMSDAEMLSDFSYRNYTQYPSWYVPGAATPDSNNVMGEVLDINQEILVGEAGDTTKKQLVDYRKRDGYQGFSPSAWWGLLEPITTAGTETLDGTEVLSWTEGQEVTSLWIVQSSNVGAVPGTEAADVSVAYQRLENLDDATVADELARDIPEPLKPFVWDNANFGVEPLFQ